MTDTGPLLPSPVPIGLNQEFILPHPVALLLKERVMSLSGDSFHVHTLPEGPANTSLIGPPLFQIQGDALTMSARKHFLTVAGQPIYDVRRKFFSLPAKFYGENVVTGEKPWRLEGKFSLSSSKSICTFNGIDGSEHDLLMKGNFFDSKATITDEATGAVVARIIRNRWNARDLIFGQQTYVVEVAPNVDCCLIAAMCVSLDERRNEK